MIAGHVYVVHTALTKPLPKDKITLCICAANDLFFWINTKANFSGIGQFSLAPDDLPNVLTHPSFLDCSRVTTFPPRELAHAKDRGPVSVALARRIIDFLKASPPKTLSPKHLQRAIGNLEAYCGP